MASKIRSAPGVSPTAARAAEALTCAHSGRPLASAVATRPDRNASSVSSTLTLRRRAARPAMISQSWGSPGCGGKIGGAHLTYLRTISYAVTAAKSACSA